MKRSAGILVYRRSRETTEVLLAHPGGPYWAKKDLGAWTIPKGEFEADEEPLIAAQREFEEEIGQKITGQFMALAPVRLPSGKIVHAFAVAANVDTSQVVSNLFEMEWPPHSGRRQSFPEVDRAAWFELSEARRHIQSGQLPLLDELADRLASEG